jgi:chromate transporter
MIQLFLSFFKIGMFSFGGGLAAFPLIAGECAAFITPAQFSNAAAAAQAAPGAIGLNMAAFVGLQTAGLGGAVVASLGFCLPSFLLVTAALAALERILKNKRTKKALSGANAAAAALSLAAGVNMTATAIFSGPAFAKPDLFSLAVFSICLIICLVRKVNPIFVIVGAAVVGVLVSIGIR